MEGELLQLEDAGKSEESGYRANLPPSGFRRIAFEELKRNAMLATA